MSYDIRIVNKKTGETVKLNHKHNIAGGTFALGGTNEAWFNITYNYAPIFYDFNVFKSADGIRTLYGRPLAEVERMLSDALKQLPHEPPTENYWDATVGNARVALFKLKMLVELAEYECTDEDELVLEGD